MAAKTQRKTDGAFELSETPSYLIRRCQQLAVELYAREHGARGLTRQQFTVLAAVEQNQGISQTGLVELTGIDRSTLAEMIRRMNAKGFISRERTQDDQRANAVHVTPAGKKALRAARNAFDRAERALLDLLPQPDRGRFLKSLTTLAAAASVLDTDANGARPRRKSRSRRRRT